PASACTARVFNHDHLTLTRVIGTLICSVPRLTLFPYTTLFLSLLGGSSWIDLHERLENGLRFDGRDADPGVLDTQEGPRAAPEEDRKSTRLNSSHVKSSYAVFCLKKKNKPRTMPSASHNRTTSP